jgi:hypothetical protein
VVARDRDWLAPDSSRGLRHSIDNIRRELAELLEKLEYGERDRDRARPLVAELRDVRHSLDARREDEDAMDRALYALEEAVERLGRRLHRCNEAPRHCCHNQCQSPPYPPYPPYPPFPPFPPYPPFPGCAPSPCSCSLPHQPLTPCPPPSVPLGTAPNLPNLPSATSSSSSSSPRPQYTTYSTPS